MAGEVLVIGSYSQRQHRPGIERNLQAAQGQKRGYMRYQIRTVLKQEDMSSSPDKERGSRYWSAAEIGSSTWFVVETRVEEWETTKTQRWVTTSIREAVRIQRSQVPYTWSRIYICLRAPLSVRSATVFEVVTEAYEIDSDGSYLFKLENGLSFISDEVHEQGVQPCPKELRLVYAQQR